MPSMSRPVEEIGDCFQRVAADPNIGAVIFSGDGPFFSFGFDIAEFSQLLERVIFKVSHEIHQPTCVSFHLSKTPSGCIEWPCNRWRCMLALACDYRIMVSGKAKISLNEITFGSSVFAGSVAMLKFLVGGKNAQAILYDGAMYPSDFKMAR